MFIQSFILRRCASASSSGLPVNSGLKCNQFNCGTRAGGIGCMGIGCAGGTSGCIGGMGSCTGGTVGVVLKWAEQVVLEEHLPYLFL